MKKPVALKDLLSKGIRPRSDGHFLRSAGMGIDEETFEILRAYALYSQSHRIMWIAGAKVRDRFLNPTSSGSPKGFVAVTGASPDLFGKLWRQDMHCYSDVEPDKWDDDTLVAVGLNRDDTVLAYTGVRIDLD